jgi:hypothetical protein
LIVQDVDDNQVPIGINEGAFFALRISIKVRQMLRFNDFETGGLHFLNHFIECRAIDHGLLDAEQRAVVLDRLPQADRMQIEEM